ncbi:MAG: hypothetical protein BGO55_14070 [Sphingobacteriales bacterium 50-39]|nr:hypothetical protein [Sphingobacteriales bacterium]OJW57418.1 MAG: hypothetical protein BGO55_14070 [Sphingobacteriales bacterium 50-39]
MKIHFNALFFGTLFLLSSCHSQHQPVAYKGYVIDPSIKAEVEKEVQKLPTGFEGSMYIKMFENDSLLLDSYKEGKAMECFMLPFLESDTATIIGSLGFTAASGFYIYFLKDTCIIRHFAKSDAEIYKLHPEDSLSFEVLVPSKSYTLTLIAPPQLKKGGLVEGRLDLVSEEYHEVANGADNKLRTELTGYFKVKLNSH